MTSALIPPVIPSRPAPSHRPRGRPGVVRTLPLAAPAELTPALATDVVYGLGRIDASGRVADRPVIRALGWHDGDRLTLTASAGVVTARRDPDGRAILPPRHRIVIPATLRYRCGLLPGDPVLLAARPAEDTLTAYSLAVVDQALAALIPFPAREKGDR
jgi:hypothetical protein